MFHCRAGKGPQGLHLDVSKQNNLIEVSYIHRLAIPLLVIYSFRFFTILGYYSVVFLGACACIYFAFSPPLQKLIIDEKPCYLFGRNKDVCDFNLEHTSCSRVHAALVFHKHLKRSFLVDLNSSEYCMPTTGPRKGGYPCPQSEFQSLVCRYFGRCPCRCRNFDKTSIACHHFVALVSLLQCCVASRNLPLSGP